MSFPELTQQQTSSKRGRQLATNWLCPTGSVRPPGEAVCGGALAAPGSGQVGLARCEGPARTTLGTWAGPGAGVAGRGPWCGSHLDLESLCWGRVRGGGGEDGSYERRS